MKNSIQYTDDERRSLNMWALDKNIDDYGLKAHALYEFLKSSEDFEELSEEDEQKISQIEDQIETLKFQSDDSTEPNPEVLDKISELENQLQNLYEKSDIYKLDPIKREHYYMTVFEVNIPELEGREYAVGDEYDIDRSVHEYVDQLIDDVGYKGLRLNLEDFVDVDRIVDYLEDYYREDIWDSPDAYLDEEDRMLAGWQESEIRTIDFRISKIKSQISKIESYIEKTDNEEYINASELKIEELEDSLEDLEDEKKDIQDSPQGDFPDNLIEGAIEEKMESIRRYPLDYARDFDLELEYYVDKDEIIDHIIETDGYEIMSSYDGEVDSIKIKDVLYYIIRLD